MCKNLLIAGFREIAKSFIKPFFKHGSVRRVVRGAKGIKYRVGPGMGATYGVGIGYHPSEYDRWVRSEDSVIDDPTDGWHSPLILKPRFEVEKCQK